MNKRTEDLTGRKFGELTVLRMLDTRKNRNVAYACQCSCGNVINVRADSLKSGQKSCIKCSGLLKVKNEEHKKYLIEKKSLEEKYDSKKIARYNNMRTHLRFDVELSWIIQFEDFDKLKFLNDSIQKRGERFRDDSEWYKKYIEKFYYDETFNSLYSAYRISNDKYKRPSLDHIIPRSKGGTNELSNLRFITFFENMCKRDMDLKEWELIKANLGDYLS